MFHYDSNFGIIFYMFNSLTGTITGKFPQKVFLMTNGIEWDLTVPDSNIEKISSVGETGKIYTYLQHSDQGMCLFGFASVSDRNLFFDLLKVDGIGPKAAVKIMGSISTVELARVLDEGDVGRLEKVPGVGKKTAGKILLQLKGKLTLDSGDSTSSGKSVSAYQDVVQALVDMGYDKSKVQGAIDRISRELSNDESFSSSSQSQKEDFIFKRAIVELAS